MSWQISGTYFESCNCDPICPCRRIDGAGGGRSTHGVCIGVLSWVIDSGHAGDVDLAGIPVALALSYDDDVPGSPWTWVLYVDARADAAQHAALAEIFSGDRAGDALKHFPWAWKPSTPLGVRSAEIEVDHTRRRQRLRIRDHVSVRIRGAFGTDSTVSCVIPGHARAGEELVADELSISDGPLAVELSGICGYAATFEYAG